MKFRRMKRMISILLVTILTMSVFAGCAREELSFYNLYKDLNELVLSKPVRSEGKVSFSLDTLPQEMLESGMDDSEIEVINGVIAFTNDNSFVYTMDSDVKNNKTVAQFDLSSNNADESIPLMTVIRNVDTTYVKLDDYIQAIKDVFSSFVTEEEMIQLNDEFDSVFGGIEYISISDEELITFYANLLGSTSGSSVEGELIAEQFKGQLDAGARQKQSEAYSRFVDQMLEEVYSDYSMDIVEKEDDKYSITFDADNLGDTVIGFLDYSLENSEDLVDAISEYILELSDEEYSLLVGVYAMDMMNKELLVDELKDASEDFIDNKDQYKDDLEEALVLYNSMMKAYIEGSMLTFTIGEEDDVFTRDTMLKVQVNDIVDESVTFDATMTINESFEEIDSFDVEVPTDNVVTFTEYLDRMPKSMQIYVDYDMYVMMNISQGQLSDTGLIDTIIKDGSSYLPTRMIAEKFGETIEWDNEVKKPYLLRDGEKLYINEFIIEDGVSYVKVREFENFGYTIGWDGDARLITIEK